MFAHSNLLRFAVAALACAGLSAQAPARSPWDAGASLVLPLDGLKKVTQASGLGGLVLEGGYNGYVHGTKLPFRASVSLNAFPGKEVDYVKSSLLGLQVAADVFAPTGIDRLSMVTGLSLNRWRWDYQDATHRVTSTMKGPKMGARFGFDYEVNPRLTASLLLQVTELGVDAQSIRGYNPTWIQAGAKYRF
ncbi:MAG TPA: hypothetical protein VJ570_00625 [Holophagaceae bacterium]|nr:hypothetical protein [Holophagaceae bacterium]